MAFQATQLSDSSGDESLNKNLNSISEKSSGFCECNICLDSARDPVVTLCGHLYCWPCIYKWLHVQTSSLESDKQPKCPVCKARISNSSLVPLYGRGSSPSSEPELKRASDSGLVIPNRPPAPGGMILGLNQQTHPGPFQGQTQPHVVNHAHPFGSYTFGPSNQFGPMTQTGFSNPFVGMVGEMVCAMIFRSPDSGTSSPRGRRQVMQVEKSLNRLTIFLFCCFFLCLVLF